MPALVDQDVVLESDPLTSAIVDKSRHGDEIINRSYDVPIEPWVTLQDVATHLQLAEDTIHRWIKRGLPATKAGRVWRFKLSEVDSWVRSGKAVDHQHAGMHA